ncbi:alternative ribosome rescue aminoacyl-tRNA hydrolase ArfB [Motilimonas sp. KMU-193]|uniref:alternative ribosome rescue aminoacyl-tRNA hydrolase ArfB n=1 Tax=Motilimonas sp. KMU-193 TaxID=3388668 RepID=UPI00396B15E2
MIISQRVIIPIKEIEFTHIRAQGAGGQHINKVSSAIQLRFNFLMSPSLPDTYKEGLSAMSDQRISKNGDIIIKAQTSRSQDTNKQEALERLVKLIQQANVVQKRRIATKPSRAAKARRLNAKTVKGNVKKMRAKVSY